jgi:hypothetical protein
MQPTSSSEHIICRFCHINEAWANLRHPCLACQLATLIFRNPFLARLETLSDNWLNEVNSDDNSELSNAVPSRPNTPRTLPSDHELLDCRTRTIERSFQEIRSRGSPAQTSFVFEDLSMLKNNIQNIRNNCFYLKRDFASQEDSSITSFIPDEHLSPTKRGNSTCDISKKDMSLTNQKIRIPLAPIDLNSILSDTSSLNHIPVCPTNDSTSFSHKPKWGIYTSNQATRHERTLRIKELRRKEKQEQILNEL